MELIDVLRALSARMMPNLALIQTEEATKNALVLPFLNALGYNVFDPTEVVPEFTADIGTKKGEKVDYAIVQNGKPIMLIECKHVGGDLSLNHAGQLLRYFHVTEARIGVLTNGLVYRFYTDLEKPNRMDERAFLEVDLADLDESAVSELKKLSKGTFNLDQMLAAATDLKYLRAFKVYIAEQFAAPSDEFVRLMAKQAYDGSLTAKMRDQMGPLVRRALQQFLSERVAARLQSAIESEVSGEERAVQVVVPTATVEAENAARMSETTEEEREGFMIVRALLRPVVDVSRVVMRDVQSYCGILLDDNNRKPLVRLHFNGARKFVTVFDVEAGERVDISSLDDLYGLEERLRAAAARYAT